MSWEFNNSKPIYTQIEEEIKKKIISGTLKEGEKIQSVRDLAGEAGVNPNTMQKAFTELERSGLIITQRTSGRLVTEDLGMIKEIQQDLATEQIVAFFDKMKELGFEKEEIISLLQTVAEKGAENE